MKGDKPQTITRLIILRSHAISYAMVVVVHMNPI